MSNQIDSNSDVFKETIKVLKGSGNATIAKLVSSNKAKNLINKPGLQMLHLIGCNGISFKDKNTFTDILDKLATNNGYEIGGEKKKKNIESLWALIQVGTKNSSELNKSLDWFTGSKFSKGQIRILAAWVVRNYFHKLSETNSNNNVVGYAGYKGGRPLHAAPGFEYVCDELEATFYFATLSMWLKQFTTKDGNTTISVKTQSEKVYKILKRRGMTSLIDGANVRYDTGNGLIEILTKNELLKIYKYKAFRDEKASSSGDKDITSEVLSVYNRNLKMEEITNNGTNNNTTEELIKIE